MQQKLYRARIVTTTQVCFFHCNISEKPMIISMSADDGAARAAAAGQEVCRGHTPDPEATDGPRAQRSHQWARLPRQHPPTRTHSQVRHGLQTLNLLMEHGLRDLINKPEFLERQHPPTLTRSQVRRRCADPAASNRPLAWRSHQWARLPRQHPLQALIVRYEDWLQTRVQRFWWFLRKWKGFTGLKV